MAVSSEVCLCAHLLSAEPFLAALTESADAGVVVHLGTSFDKVEGVGICYIVTVDATSGGVQLFVYCALSSCRGHSTEQMSL